MKIELDIPEDGAEYIIAAHVNHDFGVKIRLVQAPGPIAISMVGPGIIELAKEGQCEE